jgi:hypothetical protein
MHSLSTSFILGYHGCEPDIGEKLLRNEQFRPSKNAYDWLGSGIYFWESNPDRALDWSRQQLIQRQSISAAALAPFVVGAIIDLGFCLDLVSANGLCAVEATYSDLQNTFQYSGDDLPQNSGGEDFLNRKLDCMVVNYLHQVREESGDLPFDTVRAVFMEGERLYPSAGFRRKTHIQICVRNPECIKGVFRVPDRHFSAKGI